MRLKHSTNKELFEEISKRVDKNEIKWGTTYFYDVDERTFYLKSESEKFELSFTQEAKTEYNFFIHNVYKRLEPKKVKEVKKIQAEQEKERLKQAESEQKEKEKKFMEGLKIKLKKV